LPRRPAGAQRGGRAGGLEGNEGVESPMIGSIDHVVLTTRDLDKCLDFYTRVLGMKVETYGKGRIALRFGNHKFNVHPPGFEAGLKARTPTPGPLDLCFLADRPLDEVIVHLKKEGIPIEAGPDNRA